MDQNSTFVYGRKTGWGQNHPFSQSTGHDINYIPLHGKIRSFGYRNHIPVNPLNMIGDFGGGDMMLVFGTACGIFEVGQPGKVQVIDVSEMESRDRSANVSTCS